jgi:hypothetical protein
MAGQNTAKGHKYILQLDDEIKAAARAKVPEQSRTDVTDELTRKERLKNDDAEQNIRLKRVVLNRLFWFLGIETVLIFTFTFLQATRWFGFLLEEWSFNILITATIAQIAGMLFVAVRYLFPTKEEK